MHVHPHTKSANVIPPSLGWTLRALKAENTPPVWYRDSVQLQQLLSGAWDKVSKDFVKQLISAFQSGETSRIESLLKQLKGLGVDMTKALGNSPDAVFENVLAKSEHFWRRHAIESGITEPATFGEAYREKLITAQANQIRSFSEAYPERILHPEILRQLDHLQEAETPDALTISTIADRLERVVTDNPDEYWQKLTDVEVSRTWQADGVEYARENGVRYGRIDGPDPSDPNICPVCMHFYGMPVNLEDAADKFNSDLDIEDPEEYVAAWPFPRLADVDNISREELAQAGWLPPFHPHCRHSISWFSVARAPGQGDEVAQEEAA